MKACQLAKVKRCVVTSSTLAISEPDDNDYPKDGVLTEKHWSNPENQKRDPNNKSKTLAEKAAWNYQTSVPVKEQFEVVTINPGFVMGPPIKKVEFASGEFFRQIMEGERRAFPPMEIEFVDVRDVA